MPEEIQVMPVRTVDDLKQARQAIVDQRDQAMNNYHRCCGALALVDNLINAAIAQAAEELNRKAMAATDEVVKGAMMAAPKPKKRKA